MAARDGLHPGDATKPLRKSTPSLATLSTAGVFTNLAPTALACGHDQSSAMQKRMFGLRSLFFSAAAAVLGAARARSPRSQLEKSRRSKAKNGAMRGSDCVMGMG